MRLRLWSLASLVAISGLVAGCDDLEMGFPGVGDPIPNDITIVIQTGASSQGSSAFGENPRLLREGAVVTWVNEDTEIHDLVADDNEWASGPIPPGGRFAREFGDVGTFRYSCRLHGESGTLELSSEWEPQGAPSGSPVNPAPVASPTVPVTVTAQ